MGREPAGCCLPAGPGGFLSNSHKSMVRTGGISSPAWICKMLRSSVENPVLTQCCSPNPALLQPWDHGTLGACWPEATDSQETGQSHICVSFLCGPGASLNTVLGLQPLTLRPAPLKACDLQLALLWPWGTESICPGEWFVSGWW